MTEPRDKKRDDPHQSHPTKSLKYQWFLLPEISLQQALEGFAVAGFVTGHFMHGVVDGIEVQSLGTLCQISLAGGGAVALDGAECLGTLIFYGFWDDLSR